MAGSLSYADIGVVFDLDGVLIDSHDQHERSWFQLAAEVDKPLTKEQFKESFGMRNVMCIPNVFHWTSPEDHEQIRKLGDRKEELYRELLRADGIEPLPGVVDLLQSLNDAGVLFSLGSSTSRKNIEVCFASTGLDRFFGPFYTGAEDVTRGKPFPDVFLEAAAKIDRLPARCLVIEDAHVGVEAGIAAGMKVLAVTTTHTRESFTESGAVRVVDSLAEIDAVAVLALLSATEISG
ncbi:MAG: HAD family phosphatase [Verrucomicrobiales bacterium]|jgi:HAD superfamily hydrolase (TIGR01509 family)|nr:HAD family phosphatase [Verrucomicrobiales bacterium]MDP4791692.1 HAD family phosphatase [Verrucomicrobiales bacterium]MDP4940355.1 HAD family phosphatase [Verrucomicrobiales bacterium]MDP5005767.1 HAD family phosphatase [Verrucomicrobiales bacterium]